MEKQLAIAHLPAILCVYSRVYSSIYPHYPIAVCMWAIKIINLKFYRTRALKLEGRLLAITYHKSLSINADK